MEKSSLAPASATLVSPGVGRGARAAYGPQGLPPWAVRALAVFAVLAPVAMAAVLSDMPRRVGVPAAAPSDWGQTRVQASAPVEVGPEAVLLEAVPGPSSAVTRPSETL